MSDVRSPTALDVAQAVLERTGPLDTFKLQKLVYYCQAWHLAWFGTPLFPNRIEAWANGPVIPDLYYQHRGNFSISQVKGGDPKTLTQAHLRTVEAVVAAYNHLSGRQLAHLTHEELPWRMARQGLEPGVRGSRQIPQEIMAEFYAAIDNDPEAELVERIQSEPVE